SCKLLDPYCKDCAGLVCSQFYHFWSKELWPLLSPDCNPLDLAMVNKDQLMATAEAAWNKIPERLCIIDA
ncbi:Uncharacterized protein FKW44_005380, partial [Caligus rogercresseyi]